MRIFLKKKKNKNILINIYLDIPEPDAQTGDFQRKLEILNSGMTNDRQFRQVQQLGNCKCKSTYIQQ